jgi:hypothetical protein
MLSKHVSIFSWHCHFDASKIVKVFEIAVGSAAGGVFARLELQDVRQARRPFIKLAEKDGLSITMRPHWARGVFVVVFLRAIVLSSYRDFDGRR